MGGGGGGGLCESNTLTVAVLFPTSCFASIPSRCHIEVVIALASYRAN